MYCWDILGPSGYHLTLTTHPITLLDKALSGVLTGQEWTEEHKGFVQASIFSQIPNLIEHTGTFPIHGVHTSQDKGLKRSTAKALLPDTRTPQRSCVHGSACSKSFYIGPLYFVDPWNNLTCLLCEISDSRTKSYYLLNCIRQTVGPLKGFVINKCFKHVLKWLIQCFFFFLRGQSRFVGIWSLSCNKRLACWKPWTQHPQWLTIKTSQHWSHGLLFIQSSIPSTYVQGW